MAHGPLAFTFSLGILIRTFAFLDCGEPTIPNGFLTGSTLYDGTATVDCDSGYEGGGTATCQNNAQWETLPTCEPEGKPFYHRIL